MNFRYGFAVLFTYPYALFFFLMMGTILYLPSFNIPFLMDDYIFLNKLETPGASPYSLYQLIPEGPEAISFSKQDFSVWWSNPNLKLSFWRPLSSLLLSIDYLFFKQNPFFSHLHSLLWFMALLAAFGLLYRRILPGPVGIIALCLCTLDNAFALPASWAPNRHALVAAVPIFCALWAHLRWGEDNWKKGLPLSMIGYMVGLLGGETALSALAYLFAYEMFGSSDHLRRRFIRLLPCMMIVGLYVAIYKGWGYGTAGSDFYLDPIGQWPVYLKAAPARMLALLGDLFLGMPAELWFISSTARVALVFSGILVLVLIPFLVRGCFHRLNQKEKDVVKWLSAGMVLSLLPSIATAPSARQLICPLFGASALLAMLFYHTWKIIRGSAALRPLQKKLIIVFLASALLLHGVAAPSITLFQLFHLKNIGRQAQHIVSTMAGQDLHGKDVIILPSQDMLISFLLYPMHRFHNADLPNRWRILSMAPYDHQLKRLDSHTLQMEVLKGEMLREPIEHILFTFSNPLAVGDVIGSGIFTAAIEEIKQGPSKVRFTFEKPLDDESYVFFYWNGAALERKIIPEVNQSVTIPYAKGPLGL